MRIWQLYLIATVGALSVIYLAIQAPSTLYIGWALLISCAAFTSYHSLGIYLYLALVFFDDIYWQTPILALQLGDVGLLSLLASRFLEYIRTRTLNIVPPPGAMLLVGFFFLTGISMYLGIDPRSAMGRYVRLLSYILVLFLISDELSRRSRLILIGYVFIIVSTVHSIVAYFIHYDHGRLAGIPNQPNILASFISIGVLAVVIFSFNHPRPWVKRTSIALSPFLITSLLLTMSRNGYIATVMGLLWHFRTQWRRLVLSVGFGVIVLIVMSSVSPEVYKRIFARLTFDDQSVTTRMVLIQRGIDAIERFPFFGVGFVQFDEIDHIVEVYSDHGRSAHNNYLALMASNGTLASFCLFIFILIQWKGLRLAIRQIRDHAKIDKKYNAELLLTLELFESLFILQSTSLLFRGGAGRVFDWFLLSLYCATHTFYLKNLDKSEHKTKHTELESTMTG